MAVLFGISIHIFLMPALAGFWQLALVLFVGVFFVCWTNSKPSQAIGKSMGLAMLFMMMQVKVEQSYSFTYATNFAAAFTLILMILAVTTYLPISYRPEIALRRQIRRYFSSGTGIFEAMFHNALADLGPLARQRKAYHARVLATVPDRLAAWVGALPREAVDEAGRAALRDLVIDLRILQRHVSDVVELRDASFSKEMAEHLFTEMRSWRLALQSVFDRMPDLSGGRGQEELRQSLLDQVARLEALMTEAAEKGVGSVDSREQAVAMYGMIGAFRGVSEALVTVAGDVEKVDWRRMAENRF